MGWLELDEDGLSVEEALQRIEDAREDDEIDCVSISALVDEAAVVDALVDLLATTTKLGDREWSRILFGGTSTDRFMFEDCAGVVQSWKNRYEGNQKAAKNLRERLLAKLEWGPERIEYVADSIQRSRYNRNKPGDTCEIVAVMSLWFQEEGSDDWKKSYLDLEDKAIEQEEAIFKLEEAGKNKEISTIRLSSTLSNNPKVLAVLADLIVQTYPEKQIQEVRLTLEMAVDENDVENAQQRQEEEANFDLLKQNWVEDIQKRLGFPPEWAFDSRQMSSCTGQYSEDFETEYTTTCFTQTYNFQEINKLNNDNNNAPQ